MSPNLYPILDAGCGISFAGGAEVQQVLLATGLNSIGYDISAITLDHGQRDGASVNDIEIFKAYRQEAGLSGLRFFHPRLTGIWASLRRADADIYYQRCAGMLTGIVGLYCRLYNKKFIYAGAHDLDFISGDHGLSYRRDVLLYEWGLKNANRVIVQNQAQKKLLIRNYAIEGVLIHNIAKIANCSGSWQSKRVGWVGMVSPRKKPLRLINLARDCADIEFLLVGGSSAGYKSLWDEVCGQSADLSNITLTGHVPYSQMNQVVKDLSILVNTSEKEGFPNTFLEAWAMGIPTISFVSVGVSSHITTPGIVVNSHKEMVNAIQRLITDKDEWEKESDRAKRAFEKFFQFSGVEPKYKELIAKI